MFIKTAFRVCLIVALLPMQGCSRLWIKDQSAPLQSGNVVVVAEPATYEEKYLDGVYWPQGKACGRAYTYWTFMCRPEFELKKLPELSKPGSNTYEITAVSMKLALPLRTWLPYAVKDKLRAHEAGHIQMCRDIYKNAESVARTCANEMLGRHVQALGDPREAEGAARTEATRTLDATYHKKIETAANECGVIYDRITNHGMNDVPESKGMKDAFAEYASTHPDDKLVPR